MGESKVKFTEIFKNKRIPKADDMDINEECVLKKYHGHDEVVVIPKGVVKIGVWAFYRSETVKEVILPASLVEIDDRAFEHSSLEKIVIGKQVKKIGYCAFQYCQNLKSINLPDNLQVIEMSTFQGCTSLTEINLPAQLTKVEENAFGGTAIKELKIPEGMTFINEKAFCYMRELEKVVLPTTLKGIGRGAFSYCDNLKEVVMFEGVIKIGASAFDACRKLEKINLPYSLVSLGVDAFWRTKITDSKELKEVYNRLSNHKYPQPNNYQSMEIGGMSFYYQKQMEIKDFNLNNYNYVSDFSDDQYIYQTKNGKKILMIYTKVPTFDEYDRMYDSYRKFFLIPDGNKITGFMISGGYNIVRIDQYEDLHFGDTKTEKMLKSTGIFK